MFLYSQNSRYYRCDTENDLPQPNFTTFTYKAGTTIHAVILGYQPVPFAISDNQIDGVAAVGKFRMLYTTQLLYC